VHKSRSHISHNDTWTTPISKETRKKNHFKYIPCSWHRTPCRGVGTALSLATRGSNQPVSSDSKQHLLSVQLHVQISIADAVLYHIPASDSLSACCDRMQSIQTSYLNGDWGCVRSVMIVMITALLQQWFT